MPFSVALSGCAICGAAGMDSPPAHPSVAIWEIAKVHSGPILVFTKSPIFIVFATKSDKILKVCQFWLHNCLW